MNTHDIELPPLPRGDIAADTCPTMWVHTDQQLQDYALAAIKADRKQRGAESQQWQPIETAPKDFVTEFDGWNGKRVPNVIWAQPEYGAKGEYAWCRPFYVPNHGWTMERVRGLSHWTPLPAPPSTT